MTSSVAPARTRRRSRHFTQRILPSIGIWEAQCLTSHSFKFNKRAELFVCGHNKAPSVVLRVNNPDHSPLGING
jgi:hypothetical protein